MSRLLDRLPHRSAPAEPPTQVLRRGRVNRVLDRLPHRSAPAAAAAAARAAAYAAAPTTAGEQPTQPLVPLKRKPTVPVRNRGRLRRRLRYLRRLREIQRRDLGGLVFELARLGRNRDDLVGLKVGRLDAIERELHALEVRLADERQWDELREPGIGGTCVSCGELYGSADRFCATCGVPLIIPPPPPT